MNPPIYDELKIEPQFTTELEIAKERLAILYKIGQVITTPLQLNVVLDTIAYYTANLLETDVSAIFLFDEDTQILTIRGAYGLSDYVVKNTRERPGVSIAGRVMQTGEPIIANDVPNDSRFYNPAATEEGLLAIASVPLKLGAKIIGTLDAQSKQDRYAFNQEHLQLLKMLASQAAIAIENARLYEELQRSHNSLEIRLFEHTAELIKTNQQLQAQIAERAQLEQHIQKSLEHRGRQVQTSTEVAQEIATAPALDELFRRVVHLIQKQFCYYHVHVYTLETAPSAAEKIPYLVMQEGTGEAGQIMKAAKHKIMLSAEKSLVALAARTAEPVLIADVFKESSWLPNALLPETRAEIAVPIKLRNEVLGVLDVQNDKVDSLDTEDQLLLLGLCGQIAIAIDYRRTEIERQQAEMALRESEATNRALLEAIPDAIFVLDREGTYLNFIPAPNFIPLVSPNEFIGRRQDEILPPELARDLEYHLRLTLQNGEVQVYEYPLEIHGVMGYYEVRLIASGADKVLGIVRDITERKQAEATLKAYSERLEEMVTERTQELQQAQERLIRQEKLAYLGQLAGGVGHELRNPLGVISNAVYFLQMVLTETDDIVKEYLEIISTRVHEAEKIVADLLDFSRNRPADREETTISSLVAEVLAQHPVPSIITLTTDIPIDLPPVFIDSQQIKQVLVNLITNAYHAMPAGGKLTINAQTQPGEVRLAITDTGIGMSAETQTKIFEPLFTTKSKGIGLGLAVSKNLVEANGGRIEVESIVGQGSSFTLTLPLTKKDY